jgi:SAM-dependent methyltransferase
MDWVRDFYSRTGAWWGGAEAVVTDEDHTRAARLQVGDRRLRVLELGSGYGATAVASARAGHTVTAVELGDRADHTPRLAAEHDVPVTLVRGDFYTVDLDGRFDAVTYWDGFGVGTDNDQRRLLTRIARDWLTPGGFALIDVFNPFVWAAQHGVHEHRDARPADGYPHELDRAFTFDARTSIGTDTWWETAHPGRRLSQHLRCYTPADLTLLLTGTGLHLTDIHPDGDLLTTAWSYLAVLHVD